MSNVKKRERTLIGRPGLPGICDLIEERSSPHSEGNPCDLGYLQSTGGGAQKREGRGHCAQVRDQDVGSVGLKGGNADNSAKMAKVRDTVTNHKSKTWKAEGRVGGQGLDHSDSSPETEGMG